MKQEEARARRVEQMLSHHSTGPCTRFIAPCRVFDEFSPCGPLAQSVAAFQSRRDDLAFSAPEMPTVSHGDISGNGDPRPYCPRRGNP